MTLFYFAVSVQNTRDERGADKMSKKLGIWIDRRKAIMVSIEGGSSKISHVESDVESPVETSGGWRSGGTTVAQCISNEQTEDARRKNRLHAFYQEIIKAAGHAGGVFIFGPGEAKHELVKEIEKIKSPHAAVSAVEACDKLTEPQIAAKVKNFFAA
jgi:hypothetical protein